MTFSLQIITYHTTSRGSVFKNSEQVNKDNHWCRCCLWWWCDSCQ